MTTVDPLQVQPGGGLCAPIGWLNFDSFPSLRLSRLPIFGRAFGGMLPGLTATVRDCDIIRGLPVTERSCSGVYSSHVIEQLSLVDAQSALANTLTVLRPGGVLTLLVPDLERLFSDYLGSFDSDAALRFMELSMLGRMERARSPMSRLWEAICNSHHLWMCDHESLIAECERAGFDRARRCTFGYANDPSIAAVEDARRFEVAVAIKARRPEGRS